MGLYSPKNSQAAGSYITDSLLSLSKQETVWQEVRLDVFVTLADPFRNFVCHQGMVENHRTQGLGI